MRIRSGRPWALLGLVGLVVLNVVLIALLLLRPGPAASTAAPAMAPSPAPTAVQVPEDDADPTPSDDDAPPPAKSPVVLPTQDAAMVPGPAERIIGAASPWVAWRAMVGSCEESAVLEYTADGGSTWEELPNALAPLQRIRVRGTETLAVIGGGAGCEPIYLASSTSGTAWSDQSQFLAGSWYLDPADGALMSTPVGVITTPCEPVDLAAATASDAALLCLGGDLRITVDGGASWTPVMPPLDALAVGTADAGYIVAGTNEQCPDAVALSLLDGTGESGIEEPTCGPQQAQQALAVTAAGGAMWLWSDDAVHVSADGGATW